MGNEQSMEENASVRIANQTEIPLVYVLSMPGPLYWGVLQPGERVTRQTGRVWFTVTCYPYDGHNEPSEEQRILGILIPTAAAIILAATGGAAFAAATPVAGTAAAALAPLTTSAMVNAAAAVAGAAGTVGGIAHSLQKEFVDAATRCLNKVEKTGHYANGDWIHVRGGIKHNEPYSAWKPMRFEG
ncbi:hypothetical protein N7539_001303 [Penicillium diatomitis]|uniref:Uncharacterized protein n=1 Tax=Penicillium diatomitis TaxID=2819901 RepID=A0A9W9XGG8_9EURO|nr:uncharacterized protein N7539_001303 [Penicillium diatomitis]KAJ5492557.1 hypothetical protein N7539_001303 [Penicillium diatomitis]